MYCIVLYCIVLYCTVPSRYLVSRVGLLCVLRWRHRRPWSPHSPLLGLVLEQVGHGVLADVHHAAHGAGTHILAGAGRVAIGTLVGDVIISYCGF